MSIQTLGGASGVVANGSDQSVTLAQQGMQSAMNKAAVQQMQLMEKQAERQLQQTAVNNNAEMMNSAKSTTEKIRL